MEKEEYEQMEKEEYEQISLIYKFFGDTVINGKSILFGSGKTKNQQGQTKKI